MFDVELCGNKEGVIVDDIGYHERNRSGRTHHELEEVVRVISGLEDPEISPLGTSGTRTWASSSQTTNHNDSLRQFVNLSLCSHSHIYLYVVEHVNSTLDCNSHDNDTIKSWT